MIIPSKRAVPFFSAVELVDILNNNLSGGYTVNNVKNLANSGTITPSLNFNPSIEAYLIITDKNGQFVSDKWIQGDYSSVYIPSFREEYDRAKADMIRSELRISKSDKQITAGHCSIGRHWHAKQIGKARGTATGEDTYWLESIDLPFLVAAFSSKFKGWPLNDFVYWHDDVVRLINCLKEDEQPTSTPEQSPERQNESDELKAVLLAQQTFWTNYDPSDPTTAPTKAMVVNFLVSRGIATSVAEKADTILRGGRRRPN